MTRHSIKSTYDSRETGDRFTLEIRENGRRLSREPMPDPFHTTTIRPRGWRVALAVLRRRYSVTVVVDGDREIVEDVLELDDNYTGRHDSTRRADWDSQLNGALRDYKGPTPEAGGL